MKKSIQWIGNFGAVMFCILLFSGGCVTTPENTIDYGPPPTNYEVLVRNALPGYLQPGTIEYLIIDHPKKMTASQLQNNKNAKEKIPGWRVQVKSSLRQSQGIITTHVGFQASFLIRNDQIIDFWFDD